MEQVSNALSPMVKPVIGVTSTSSVKNFGPAEVLGRLWFNESVGKGALASLDLSPRGLARRVSPC